MTNKKRLAILLFTLFLLALITPASQVAAQSCVQPPDGLVSWWPGDGNANDIQDSNYGTLQNGATFAPGIFSHEPMALTK